MDFFSAKELVEKIPKVFKRNDSSRERQVNILSERFSQDDINLAFALLDVMLFFDHIAIQKKEIMSGMIGPNKAPFVAFYAPNENAYGVHIRNVSRLKDSTVSTFDKERVIEEVSLSVEEAILGMAIHEVRHRLQKKKLVKIFTRKTKTKDRLMNNHLLYCRLLFQIEKRRFKKEKRKRRFINDRMKDIEFDASLIQQLFLGELVKNKKITLKKILEILFLDPIRLFNK